MSKGERLIISNDVVTEKVIEKCCELFNLNFQKSIDERQIKIYPSRIKKYLINSDIICIYDRQLMVGYMIIEKMSENVVWIKQIVIAKQYREMGLATQLVNHILEYKNIGIITNNPIMIKILKSLDYRINCNKEIYINMFENTNFKYMVDLYNVEEILRKDSSFWVLTHLKNTQENIRNIDFSPLQTIEDGYEWLVLFEKKESI